MRADIAGALARLLCYKVKTKATNSHSFVTINFSDDIKQHRLKPPHIVKNPMTASATSISQISFPGSHHPLQLVNYCTANE